MGNGGRDRVRTGEKGKGEKEREGGKNRLGLGKE